MFSNKAGEYPKRAPIGVYDTQILCKDCESIFGDWDNYAQDLLREEPKNSSPILNGSQVLGYEINSYNYDSLKLFFISISWRASVSAQPFYQRIHPGSENDFSVTLAKFDHPLGQTILDPHLERRNGVNYIRFYLGSYVAYIKTDKRKAPEPLLDFILKRNQPLIIIGRDLEQSKELPLIKKIVTVANKRMHRKA
jgi:hypothetical protein